MKCWNHISKWISFQISRERSFLRLILLALIGLGAIAMLVGRLNSSDFANQHARANQTTLAEVQDAIVAWSMQRGRDTGPERPGELPCPDTNNDGFEEGSCTAGRLGRVPWRTLGIPEPRDSSGETLWYAPAGAMRKRNSNASPLNSNSRGNIVVYAAGGVSILRNDVVFVLFAPGPPLAAQRREASTVTCATTGTTIARSNCAANYLEVADSIDNATNNGPFIAGMRSDTFNDQLRFVTTDSFIGRMEHRVALEAKALLKKYDSANGYLPFPANYVDPGCRDASYLTNCPSDMSVCRGRFPDSATTVLTPDWAVLERPDWFSYNLWGDSIYYAVGSAKLASAPANCSAKQSVSGTQHDAVLAMAGPLSGTGVRPSINLSDYLEDAENRDGWTGSAPDADRLVNPTSASNDRLYPY